MIVLVGIVAAVAAPRFAGQQGFDSRGFSDQFTTSLQYARQQAVAQRRQMCVAVTAAGYAVTRAPTFGGACTFPLLSPTGVAEAGAVPNGIAIAGAGATALPATVTFTPLGQPNARADFSIAGDTARCVTVEAETGYVYQRPTPC